MLGAGRSVAGSHLINLRRKRASFKHKSRDSVATSPPDEHSNLTPCSDTKQYVIPNFARFEFGPKVNQQKLNYEVTSK